MNKVTIIINSDCIDRYNTEYFNNHPRAKNPPIKSPQHPSLNEYLNTNSLARNNLKQKWKDFIVWRITELGLKDKRINKCVITYRTFFYSNRRHDLDNISPKFIFDGFVEAGLLVDDDFNHITRLITECGIDKENPRIEFDIEILKGDSE